MISLANNQPAKVTVETHPATPEELAAHQDYVARNRKLHFELRPDLLAQYPDRYVALTDSWALLTADSMPELVAKIKVRGDQPGESVCQFLNTKPRRQVMIW